MQRYKERRNWEMGRQIRFDKFKVKSGIFNNSFK